jgi:predicted branched-subunit amino acid permease
MGLMLYGMFIAIVVPPCKKERGVLAVSLGAIAMSLLFKYVIKGIPSGFVIMICAVAASAVGAVLFPVQDEGGAS